MKKHWWLALVTALFLVGCGGGKPEATEEDMKMDNMDAVESDAAIEGEN